MRSIIIIMCIILFSCSSNKQKIHGMDSNFLKKFNGKRVMELLDSIEDKYEGYVFLSEPPGLLSGCQFTFKNNIVLYIFTSKTEYLNRFNMKMDWDISLFLKEKIDSVRIEVKKG